MKLFISILLFVVVSSAIQAGVNVTNYGVIGDLQTLTNISLSKYKFHK